MVDMAAMVKKTIGILGSGVVGSQLCSWFNEKYPGSVAERDPLLGRRDDLSGVEIAFICVPTPLGDSGCYDTSAIHDALTALKEKTRGQCLPVVAVIKSTVLPGTTRRFQSLFPELVVMFSPEFLTERRAFADTRLPARQIIGYCNPNDRELAERVMAILPRAQYEQLVEPVEAAEAVKLFANAFYALKVSYANQFADFCKSQGINYQIVKDLAAGDPMMHQTHLDISQDGYRGFGGKCLPKDTRALFAASNGYMTLLREALRYNEELLRGENP